MGLGFLGLVVWVVVVVSVRVREGISNLECMEKFC